MLHAGGAGEDVAAGGEHQSLIEPAEGRELIEARLNLAGVAEIED